MRQWCRGLSKISNKAPILGIKAQESFYSLLVLRRRKCGYGVRLPRVRTNTFAAHNVIQKLQFLIGESIFCRLESQSSVLDSLEHGSESSQALAEVACENYNVVKVDKAASPLQTDEQGACYTLEGRRRRA